jgi:XTP/dITP diphosphohydrolase
MSMTLWFATGNAHKKTELVAILSAQGCTCNVLIPKDAGLEFAPEETGISFLENALLKARELHKQLNQMRPPSFKDDDMIIADDSGLCVDALDGRPGIFSARYAGTNTTGNIAHNAKLTSPERNALLLEELGNNPNRAAHFVCAMTLLFSPDVFAVAQETLKGEIIKRNEDAKGRGGFGYDPIFFIPEKNCTVAELPEAEKNSISHRGKAGIIIAAILKAYHHWQK